MMKNYFLILILSFCFTSFVKTENKRANILVIYASDQGFYLGERSLKKQFKDLMMAYKDDEALKISELK